MFTQHNKHVNYHYVVLHECMKIKVYKYKKNYNDPTFQSARIYSSSDFAAQVVLLHQIVAVL